MPGLLRAGDFSSSITPLLINPGDDDTSTLDEHGLLHATVRVSLDSSQVELSPSVTTPRMMIIIGHPVGVLF